MSHTHFYLARAWFLLNGILALLPQLHWAIGAHGDRIFGLPATLVYFLFVSISIAGSLIYAYWEESRREAFGS